MLYEKLQGDLTAALKMRDMGRASILRLMISELHKREIEKRSTGQAPSLTDDDALIVLQREVKKRKEAIELFKKGGREDLAAKDASEIAAIEAYLPKAAGEGDIEAVVSRLYGDGIREFGALMKQAMNELKGRADGRTVSDIVKKKLEQDG